MKRLFKLTTDLPLSTATHSKLLAVWDRATEGTDLEGSRLLLLENGMDIVPISEGVLFHEAARALDRRGKHVYAAELRKLADAN